MAAAVAAVTTGPGKVKSTKDIQSEIQAVLRQITASVTFLPILQEPCTFDLLVYVPVLATSCPPFSCASCKRVLAIGWLAGWLAAGRARTPRCALRRQRWRCAAG